MLKAEYKCKCGSNSFRIAIEVEGMYGVEKIVCSNCNELLFETHADSETFIERIEEFNLTSEKSI